MEMNGYQAVALTTAIFPETEKFNYPVFGLCEEAGEVAGKFKKIIRDSNPKRDANGMLVFTPEQTRAVALELGDVMWYVAVLAHKLGYPLEEIAEMNVNKLADRQRRGVLGGSGDNR